jgi:hypothetical protein
MANNRLLTQFSLLVINPRQKQDLLFLAAVESFLIGHRELMVTEKMPTFFQKPIFADGFEIEKDDARIAIMGVEEFAEDRIGYHRSVTSLEIEAKQR